MKEYFQAYKHYFYLILVLLAIIVVLLLVSFSLLFPNISPSSSKNDAYPSQKNTLSPYLKIDDKTTVNELESDPTFIKKTKLPNGNIQYLFSSPNNLYNNVVITSNDKIIFEKAITVDSYSNHPSITSYIEKYGEPEKIIKGSKTRGEFETFYIYASQGFTIIGNPFTDEVDELQTYKPTSVNEYIRIWGSDIDRSQNSKEEAIK